jgi:hypothetical protein
MDCGRADGGGICRPRPEGCAAVFDPVCGCDGETYSNGCTANAAGVAVDYEGECRAPEGRCGGIAGGRCQENEYCEYEGGGCGFDDGDGVCRRRPDACAQIFDPVCGCDGMTYGNACTAASAGVSVQYDGECREEPEEQACGSRGLDPCLRGQYCNFPDNGCGFADRPGVCEARPDVCPAIFDPVCGCDNVDYGNSCEAASAGVDVQYDGMCEDGPPPADICDLPADPGPCRALIPRWYFNSNSGECEEFNYGGCQGNDNNFESLRACEAACGRDEPNACMDAQRDDIVAGGGRSFGECIGECRFTLTIAAAAICDRAVLEICSWDREERCRLLDGGLTEAGHLQARGLALELEGVRLQERYGCPDCADGGASQLRLIRNGVESTHEYEFGNPPDVLAEHDRFIQGTIDALQNCEETDFVLPNCR